MDRGARGAALVSLGSITLVVMAMLVKQVGSHIPAIEILFFRSFIGFFFVLPSSVAIFSSRCVPNGSVCTPCAA